MKIKSGLEHIKTKLVIAGDVLELYEYEKGYTVGHESKGGRLNGGNSENKKKNRADTLARAKRTCRRLINANAGQYGKEFTTKFLTLTFREHITNLKEANYEFTKFMKRLNYQIFESKKSNIKYTVVPEFTKIGRIHYHVVLYNLPYLKSNALADVWGNGFIKINKIDEVDNVGAYVTKYMTKDADDERLEGEKCYFNSRGLLQPTEIKDKKIVDKLAGSIPLKYLKYTNTFDNDYTGKITYSQFNLSNDNDVLMDLKLY